MSSTIEQNLELSSVNTYHPADEFSVISGLNRLPGETVDVYRTRILDTGVRPAGGDANRLLVGANRQNGFLFERGLTISLKDGVSLFDGPKFDVTNSSIHLYSAWDVNGNQTEELSIDIFNDFKSDYYDYGARYLIEVVDIINTYSNVFSASLAGSSYSYRLASNLVPSSSVKVNRVENVSNRFSKLNYQNIVPRSLIISNPNFTSKKYIDMADWDTSDNFTGPSDADEIWIDLNKGIIIFGDEISSTSVHYMYSSFPLTVYVAPIEIYEFTDSNFQKVLETTREDAFGLVKSYIPSKLGAKWINKLYEEAKHFWGGSLSTIPLAADPTKTTVADSLTSSLTADTYSILPFENLNKAVDKIRD